MILEPRDTSRDESSQIELVPDEFKPVEKYLVKNKYSIKAMIGESGINFDNAFDIYN